MESCVRNKWILLLCLVLMTTMAFGQGIVTGSISGVVQDQQKAVIIGAKVTAINTGTGVASNAVTNAAGLFSLQNLSLGNYTVSIEATGFQKLEVADVVVRAGSDNAMGIRVLTVGRSSEVVTVEGTAPLVESTTTQIGKTFDLKQINNIPTTGGFDAFALFVPGVTQTGSAGAFGNTNGASISANGQRSRSNNFQIDGQNNNDTSVTGPSIFLSNPDVIGEFQVITNYTAEYGRNTGAVINYITKSGTNNLHGSAFGYLLNNWANSLSNDSKTPLYGYCLPYKHPDGTNRATKWPTSKEVADGTNDCTIPAVNRDIDHRVGGTVGGPIKKDKAWFFGSWMEQKEVWAASPYVSTLLTPTTAGLAQLKSAFPNSPGVAAISAFGPFAVTAGNPKVVPNSTTTELVNGVPIEMASVTRSVPGYYTNREILARVDYQVTQKDRLNGKWLYQKAPTIGSYEGIGAANGDWADLPATDSQIAVDWFRNWTNTITNQVRLSYTRINFGWNGGSFPKCTMTSMLSCPPDIEFSSGYMSFGRYTGFPQGRINNYYQLQDNGTLVRGRHTLKFGGEVDRQISPSVFLPYVNGYWMFGDTEDADGNTVSGFQNFINNAPLNTRITDGPDKMHFTTFDYAAYFQDDWRIKSNLTLQLGVRWEMYAQATNNLHDMTVAQQKSSNPFWNTSLPLSRTTFPYINPDTNNFSPILGFAWTPSRALFGMRPESMVIRGGFRIAYDTSFYNIFSNVYGGAPVVNQANWTSGAIPGLPAVTTWEASAIRPALIALAPRGDDPGKRSQAALAPNFRNPYSQQWNIGVQQGIGSRMAAEVRYVGSHTVGLYQTVNGNPALNPFINQGFSSLIPSGLTPCADSTMPGYKNGYVDCTKTIVTERGNFGMARYDALQTRFDVSNWHGLTFNLGYTYSRNLDNSSETYTSTTVGLLSINPNPFSPHTRQDWGTSAISFPNVASVAMSYDLPFAKGQKGAIGKVLGGWTINTTYRYSSGAPWTAYQPKQSWNGSTSNNLCDPMGTFSTSTDACRPILMNDFPPLRSVGFLYTPTSGTYKGQLGVYDYYTYRMGQYGLLPAGVSAYKRLGDPSMVNQVHYLINNLAAMQYLGQAPWSLSMPRNVDRGDTINNANLAVYKNFKLNERFNLQAQAQVYNVLNRQYRATPNAYIGNLYDINQGGSFGTTYFRGSGSGQSGSTQNGVGVRAFQFALKLTF